MVQDFAVQDATFILSMVSDSDDYGDGGASGADEFAAFILRIRSMCDTSENTSEKCIRMY
mgnify:CR=1 FL=1